MDIDELICALTDYVGYPVEEGKYLGYEDKYIAYVYEDEKPVFYVDDKVLADTVYIQLSFYCPKPHAYKEDKRKIRNYLEQNGFQVTSIQAWIEDKAITGTDDVRHVVFSINYTQERLQEE